MDSGTDGVPPEGLSDKRDPSHNFRFKQDLWDAMRQAVAIRDDGAVSVVLRTYMIRYVNETGRRQRAGEFPGTELLPRIGSTGRRLNDQ